GRVDHIGHGWEEVGAGRKQRGKVGHHAVLPDEGTDEAEVGVLGAAYHLALVVDATGDGGKSSRQSVQVFEHAIPPKRGKLRCAVSAADCPDNLALVVDAEGETAIFEVGKRQGSVFVSPKYGVKCLGAGSRVAYGLTLIVDALCFPVCILTHRVT